MPSSLGRYLFVNQGNDKEQVATAKILEYHSTIDMMMPLFEWDLKMLPRAASWFNKVRGYPVLDAKDIETRALHAIYHFIRTFPGELEGLNDTHHREATVGSKRKNANAND